MKTVLPAICFVGAMVLFLLTILWSSYYISMDKPRVRFCWMIQNAEKHHIDEYLVEHHECRFVGITHPCGLPRTAFFECEK